MSVTQEHIKALAHLARVAINENEIADFQHDVSDILNYIGELQSVNTSAVTKISNCHSPADSQRHCRLREDIPSAQLPVACYQASAPLIESHHYLVPKVIDA